MYSRLHSLFRPLACSASSHSEFSLRVRHAAILIAPPHIQTSTVIVVHSTHVMTHSQTHLDLSHNCLMDESLLVNFLFGHKGLKSDQHVENMSNEILTTYVTRNICSQNT